MHAVTAAKIKFPGYLALFCLRSAGFLSILGNVRDSKPLSTCSGLLERKIDLHTCFIPAARTNLFPLPADCSGGK